MTELKNNHDEAAPEEQPDGPGNLVDKHEKPCGCTVMNFERAQQYQPCIPHALEQAGQLISAAGALMGQQKAEKKAEMNRPKSSLRIAQPGDVPNHPGMPRFGTHDEGKVT